MALTNRKLLIRIDPNSKITNSANAKPDLSMLIKKRGKEIIIIKLRLLAKISDIVYFHIIAYFTNQK